MNKLIAIPYVQYKNLIDRNHGNDAQKQEDVIKKNLKNDEILQRQRDYAMAEEELPKTFDKPMKNMYVTSLPPPSLRPKKPVKPKKKKKIQKEKTVKRFPKKGKETDWIGLLRNKV